MWRLDPSYGPVWPVDDGQPEPLTAGRYTCDAFAPRALLHRPKITIEVTPSELGLLIEALETRALRAAEECDLIDYADFLFQRVAQLRGAGR